ncbi:MAG: quinol monooxygenase YgiN [Arenicella sp.]|jgi:quinol monooxygenase YgiN
MVRLTSKWKLKNGLTPEVLHNLAAAAELIQSKELGTLMYLIHLEAPFPLDSSGRVIMPPPSLIPNDQQTDITFIEVYKDADAFSAHINGSIFLDFLYENLKYFEEDPEKPGWPVTETHVLELDAGFIRPEQNW